MTEVSQYKDDLVVQIREAYGRITYTYTSHLKLMNRLSNKNNIIKILQITFSAISTGGFVGALVINETASTVIGGVFSTLLLAINLFFKDFNLHDEMKQHRAAADELWLVREQYISLLTDAPLIDIENIVTRRNELQSKTYDIYKQYPKTDAKSYAAAQIALKKKEEQFFRQEEIDNMLPSHLRIGNNLSTIDKN